MVNSHLAVRRLSTAVALVTTEILFSSFATFIFFWGSYALLAVPQGFLSFCYLFLCIRVMQLLMPQLCTQFTIALLILSYDVVFAVFPGFTTVFAFVYFFMLAPAFYAYVEQTVPEPVILVPYVTSSYVLCLFFDHFLSTMIQRYHLFSF